MSYHKPSREWDRNKNPSQYDAPNKNAQIQCLIQIPKYECPNTNVQIRMPKYNAPNTNVQIQIPKYECPNTNPQIQMPNTIYKKKYKTRIKNKKNTNSPI